MNIKKFLIVSCLMFQFSTILYASSQANFNAAFLAFGGGSDLPTEATNTKNDKGKLSLRSGSKIAASKVLNNSPESTIVFKYVTGQNLTAAELASLNNAFDVAQGNVPVVTPPAPAPTPAPVPNPSTPVVTPAAAPTANQTNGNALQQQIEAAKALFNQYVPNTYTATPVIATASLPA